MASTGAIDEGPGLVTALHQTEEQDVGDGVLGGRDEMEEMRSSFSSATVSSTMSAICRRGCCETR